MDILNVVIKIDTLYKLLIKKIYVSEKMRNIIRQFIKQKDNEKMIAKIKVESYTKFLLYYNIYDNSS